MNSETNIKYSSLKRYLRDLGYGDKDARRSIKKLRAMDPALKQAFALYSNCLLMKGSIRKWRLQRSPSRN